MPGDIPLKYKGKVIGLVRAGADGLFEGRVDDLETIAELFHPETVCESVSFKAYIPKEGNDQQ